MPQWAVVDIQTHPWFTDLPAWVAGLLPGTEIHLVSGAGHAVVGSHTGEVARVLTDFLARHPRR